ncbi:MAG TPA: hypothetical protein VGD91_24140 [Trebonia sp.]
MVDPLAAPETAAEVAALAELDAPVAAALLELLALDELLPHAATSRVAAPAATVAMTELCLTFSPLDQIAGARP